MTSRRFNRLLTVIVAGGLATIGLVQPNSAQTMDTVRLGYDLSMSAEPLQFAYEKGLFKKYGIDLKETYVDTGETMTQGLVGGSLDFAENGFAPAVAAAVAGADIVFIGGISNKLPFQLVVTKDVKTPADLKGKRIAISRFGAASDVAARVALAQIGLTESDVKVLQLGGEGTRTAALASGQIDGSMEQYPRTGELELGGYHVLADCTSAPGDYPNTSYDTTRAFIAKKPDVVKRFMAAVSEGIRLYKSDRAEALASTAAFLKLKPGKTVEEAYDFYTQKVFSDPPYPSLSGIRAILDDLKAKIPQAGKIDPAQLVDTSALDQLSKEGFFDRSR